MPTAPKYGQEKAQVTPLPGARLSAVPSPDTFGAGVGDAVAKAGASIYGHELELANEMRVEEGTNSAYEARRALTYGRQGDDPGFLASKGSQVLDRESGQPLATEYLEKYDKRADEILKAAGNDVQRAMLAKRLRVVRDSFASDLEKHEYAQTQTHYNAVADGTLSLSLNNAAQRYENDEEIALNFARYSETLERKAQLLGLDGEARSAFVASKTSDFHKAVISRAANDNAIGRATTYFERNKSQIDASDHGPVQTMLRETTRRVEVETWDNVAHTLNEAANRIYTDPLRFDSEMREQITAIDSLPNVSDKQRVRMRTMAERTLTTAFFERQIEQDARGTLDKLQGKSSGNDIPPSDPDIVSRLTAAIQSAEGSKADSVSPQGARGVMQITRATFKDYAQPGESFDNEADRVRAARRKIEADFAFYGGDAAKVAAAYIGGRGAVKADGSIRDDVKDALGTTPAKYAQTVVAKLGLDRPDKLPATGDARVDRMPFDLRMQLVQRARTAVNQGQAVERQRLTGKMQDFEAMARTGVEIPPQSIPTEDEFKRALGDAAGTQAYNERVIPALQLNADVKEVSRLPNDQHGPLLASRAPRPGDTFVEDSRRQASLAQAIQLEQKRRADDPAAYVLQSAPGVRQAFDAIQAAGKDPAAVRVAYSRYGEAMLAEQARLGMPQALLPKPMAESIVAQFYQQQEGGQNAAQLVKQLSDQWGRHWNQVYGQIAKQIPSAARSIGAGMPEGAAMVLAGVADVKLDDLKKGLPVDVPNDIRKALAEKFEQGRISLVSTNPRSGQDTYESTFGDAEKLAIMYAIRGKKPKEAAEQAYQDAFGHRYEFVKSGPATYRVPKTHDASMVAKGADLVRANVGQIDLALPASRTGLDAKQIREAWVDQLRGDGYWVTAPDESGLVLYNANGAAVLDSKDRPIWRSWYALSEAGRTANIGYGQATDTFNRTAGGAATGRAGRTDSRQATR